MAIDLAAAPSTTPPQTNVQVTESGSINLSGATPSTPPPVNVQAVPGGINLSGATPSTPPPANVQATTLERIITEAGVDLAKGVLWILFAALVLLSILYSCSESKYTGLTERPIGYYMRAINGLSDESTGLVSRTNDTITALKALDTRIAQYLALPDKINGLLVLEYELQFPSNTVSNAMTAIANYVDKNGDSILVQPLLAALAPLLEEPPPPVNTRSKAIQVLHESIASIRQNPTAGAQQIEKLKDSLATLKDLAGTLADPMQVAAQVKSASKVAQDILLMVSQETELGRTLARHVKTLDQIEREPGAVEKRRSDLVQVYTQTKAAFKASLPAIAFDRQSIDAALDAVATLRDSPGQLATDVQKLKDVMTLLDPAKTKPDDLLRLREKIGAAVEAIQAVQSHRPLAAAEIEKIKALNDLMKTLNESHKDARASWASLIQIILVNVLLPVLTALLGYIFGSSRRTG